MPQFDPTFFATQLFWLAVSFVVLYLLLSTLAIPRIGGVLEERQRKIDDNLDKAAELKAEAEAAIATYEKALAASRAQAQKILHDNADVLAKQSERQQKELAERLAAQVKAGEARIVAARDDALAHVREVAIEVAKTASAKLTGTDLPDAAVDQAVGAVLQESR